MFQYAFIGMLGGGIAGYFADRFQQGGEVSGAMNGSLLCGIGGAVLGLIVGSPQKYLLNVDHLHAGIIHRFGLVGGMTFSMLVGGFSDGRSFGTTELDHFACGLFYRQPLTEMFRLRLELLYETKGGNYDYSGEYLPSSYYLKEETATVKLTEVEVPCLLEIGKRSYSSLSFQGLIGPALNYYLHGQLEEYQVGYHNNNIKLRQVPVKAHPYLSILMGCDIQWNTNFATEFLWDQELTSSGNIRMINGGELNLKQNDLLIRVAYTL